MPSRPEQSPPKAARILSAAGELLLGRGARGVTVADVAARAHVGKGTVYLYWNSKEDLLLDLICRDFVALTDEIITAVSADPDLARPSRLCPNMLGTAERHPLVAALQNDDDELLGVLAQDPRAVELFETLGPHAVTKTILPIWRRHGLAARDWDLADQALALHALTTGFLSIVGRPGTPSDGITHARVFAATVTSLLGPEQATTEQVQAAAEEGISSLREARSAALEIIEHRSRIDTA